MILKYTNTQHTLIVALEQALVALPAFRNATTNRTDPFELKHQEAKQVATGKRIGRHGDGGEPLALKHSLRMATVRAVFQGMRWGDDFQYQASDRCLSIRDYRPGKGHLPHPIIDRLTRWLPQVPSVDEVKWLGCGPWVPSSYQKKVVEIEPVGDQVAWSHLRHSYEAYFTDNDSEPLPGHITFPVSGTIKLQYFAKLTNYSSSRRLVIKTGDDVAVMYAGKTAYCNITEMFISWVSDERPYLWFVPAWYEVQRFSSYAQDRPSVHSARKTILLRKPASSLDRRPPPITVGELKTQVAIVHSCKWSGSLICKVTQQLGSSKLTMVHCKENTTFEVADRAAGFIARFE